MSITKLSEIVIATGNPGKLREFRELLSELPLVLHSQAELGLSEADETGLSFVENAILKARHASMTSGLPAIADDSGLSVDALQGEPGIYSARYSGQKDDAANNRLLLENLKPVPAGERTARFHCALVFVRYPNDPCPLVCQASWEGEILFEARGDNGFGYDPLFFIPELDSSSAELSAERKNTLSHRGQAMQKLLAELRSQQSL